MHPHLSGRLDDHHLTRLVTRARQPSTPRPEPHFQLARVARVARVVVAALCFGRVSELKSALSQSSQ